jgi:hypothetical protein
MNFRIEFDPAVFQNKINVQDRVLMVGSCFTEHIHAYFKSYKFTCLQNPHGTLFNPISIFSAIETYTQNKVLDNESLFNQNGLWNNWDFHSSLSHSDKELALEKMNQSINSAHLFLKETDWLIITLGTSFVYEYENQFIVANCHKVPATKFSKRLLQISEIEKGFEKMMLQIKSINPNIKIIFTVSPVRHLRDGFVENNRSKSILLHVVGEFANNLDVFYFPSYELIIDDLRDYRFYAEDMVHPNYQATKYVWSKFCTACIDGKSRELMKEIDQLNNAIQHKPMHPESNEHMLFIAKFKSMSLDLANRFPKLDWSKELAYFSEI